MNPPKPLKPSRMIAKSFLIVAGFVALAAAAPVFMNSGTSGNLQSLWLGSIRSAGEVFLLAPDVRKGPNSPNLVESTTPLTPFASSAAIDFDGSNDRLVIGDPAALKLTTFTIETWFRRDGTGVTTTTSGATGGGLLNAIPLVTKGRGEGETPANINMNYFLGIDDAADVLAADFEDTAGGINHAVLGRTVICNGVWYHAAVTFDGTKWQLFLNGELERELAVAFTPESTSIQHFGIGTAYNSTGVAAGFFNGAIDDVRVWNSARTQAEIKANLGIEIPSATGLVGSWNMNEGSGTTTADTSGNGNDGTLANDPLWTTGTPFTTTQNALDLTPNTYVTFGPSPGLGAAAFTLEGWFNRQGTGTGTSTGTGGLPDAVPLITKGRAQSDNSNLDMNYFLGIEETSGVVVVDFENNTGGGNHPFSGTTVLALNTWNHIAATYDGSVWRLYVNGNPEGTSTVIGTTPRFDSIQHAALGSALTSTGAAAGFFDGVMDEVRIWNVARTPTEIQQNIYNEITSGTGLLGRYGLNTSCGTTVYDSDAITPIDGTITGAGGSAWVTGFPVPDLTPPADPTGLAAVPGNTIVNLNWIANGEGDLAGYNIYRSTTSPVPLTSPINGGTPVAGTNYLDNGLTNGQIYYYVITAVDTSDNESGASNEVNATPIQVNTAIQLGTTSYVTFGDPAKLDLAEFTIETWFMRTGTGTPNTTGTGGITIVPLLTHGSPESENSNVDANWILGINTAGNVIAADFEAIDDPAPTGQNFPISGTTAITDNVWHHAAATFNGTTWAVYLDGVLEASINPGVHPRSDSTQHVALGTMIQSNGTTANGRFDGAIDEARVWDHARTGTEILASKNLELTSGSGLVARWGLNEGSGTVVGDSISIPADGTVIGTGYTWVPGFVPPVGPNVEPNAPLLNAPANGSNGNSTSPTLDVSVSDPNGDALTVTYFGRPLASGNFVQIAQHTGVISGASDTVLWANLGDGQTHEWYVTVSDGTFTTTGPTWTFHTTPGPDPVFVGVGDIASCAVTEDTLTGNIMQGIEGYVWTTGDNVYDNGLASEYANCYATTPWGSLNPTPWGGPSVFSRTRPVPGNHDWGTGNTENLNGYFGYFGPNATDANGQSYYSYDIPGSNWHIVNLDSECQLVPGGCAAGSPQELWLKADLAANSTKNVIALWHKPRYSSGATNYQALQALWDDLYAAGVDLALNGHDHIYERTAPMRSGATPASPPVSDPQYGITLITAGTGGEGHHGLATPLPTSEVRTDQAFGILKLTLHATTFDWEFLPIDGETFTDSGTRAVHPAPPGPNSAPVAAADAYVTPLNTQLNVAAPGVLVNDTDADTDPLTAVLDTDVTHGSLTLNPDGSFTYSPTAGYTGPDSFTYHANDGAADSNIVTVSLSVGMATVTFQDGTNDYNGTVDTYLRATQPDTPQGASPTLEWDLNEGTGGPQYTLIRFDNLFGSGPGQIPNGVFITSATLSYTVFETGDSATVNEAAIQWTENSTFNDFGGEPDVQPDEYGNLVGTAAGGPIGVQTLDVTSSMNSWYANPSSNHGWIFRPQLSDGVDVRSSDYTTAAERPVLSVTYSTTPPNQPPNAPVLVAPTNGATGVVTNPDLTVSVSDLDGDPLTVTYYGRPVSATPPADFTIVALPDTQFYSSSLNGGSPAIFNSQTQWVVNNIGTRNIKFVTQLGDCVQNGDNGGNNVEWVAAEAAISLLEDSDTTGLPEGMPYGIAVGNHDQSPTGDPNGTTTFFNQFFGESRFLGRSYFGGHYGTNNDNHYQLFSASGMDFIIIHFEYDPAANPAVLAWANGLLQANSNRRAILVSHHFVNTGNPATFGTQGQATYDALKANPNLFLMLNGHVAGEGRRQDIFGGNTVNSLLSDYQSRTNGGNGWLRILTFSPANNQIQVQTYSPWLNQFETDADSQFALSYDMQGAGNPFTTIGSNNSVTSGTDSIMNWPGLLNNTQYEWYVTVSDGQTTVSSPVWSFATQGNPSTISGTVTYGNGTPGTPVPGTLLTAAGSPNVSTTSAFGTGDYQLSGFGSGAYTVTPSKSGDVDGILAFDAGLVARHSIGQITLNANQLTAADVTQDGTVNAADAGNIARYAVTNPNSSNTGNWKFTPSNRSYIDVLTSSTNQDYSGYLLGDVDGSWTAPSSFANAARRASDTKGLIRVAAPEISAVPGSVTSIPVSVTNIAEKGIIAYQFALEYDPNVLEADRLSANVVGTVSKDLSVVSYSPQPGLLRVAVFGPMPITSDGTLLNINMAVVGGVGSSSDLRIHEFIADDGTVQVDAKEGLLSVDRSESATIQGRLVNASGRSVSKARVTITGTDGTAFSSLSNSFGYFEFGGLHIGQTFDITVSAKRYSFAPRTVSVADQLTNVDMVADQ